MAPSPSHFFHILLEPALFQAHAGFVSQELCGESVMLYCFTLPRASTYTA